MASKNITITSVSSIDGIPTVVGTAGEVPFTATRLQWGGKVLMHVASRDLDRGTRIAVGHAAKKAVREAGLDLTPAPLKRPRKAKEAEVASDAPVAVDEVVFEVVI